jgi:hypothetical protein
MKITLHLILILLSFNLLGHENHHLYNITIDNIVFNKQERKYVVSFDINTTNKKPLEFARVELSINNKPVAYKNIESITKKKENYQISIGSENITSIIENVSLNVTRVNNTAGLWNITNVPLDSTAANNKIHQYDDVGTYELFADAPWRMNIYTTGSSGPKNSIPVLLYLHDGDGVSYPWIQYIDISIKKSTDAAFGAPLTYNSLTNAQFQALFSNKSTANTTLNRKAFDQSLPVKNASHTIAFNESNYYIPFVYNFNYTPVQNFLWYATFNIPATALSAFADADILDIKVEFTIRITPSSNPISYLRVFRQPTATPTITNWYKGDTHLHSIYTQNTAEQGLPLPATKDAAKHIGLDWIITTDHTSDFDNYGSGNVNTNWADLRTEVIALNTADPSMMYIRGQEVALKNSVGKLVHFLGYPNYQDPLNGMFLGDGNGDVVATNVTIDIALSNLVATNGFCYAAHPFATNDELSPLVNGGIWNLGDDDFATNGNTFPVTGGNIISNNPSVASDVLVNNGNSTIKFVKDALKGGQIWNDRVSMSTTDAPEDPYNIAGSNTPFAPVPNDFNFHWNRFGQGLEIINFINKKGLALKNSNNAIQNWKFYISSGADAHGSFNYSTTNFIESFVGSLGGSIQNNAVGKLMTVAYAPTGMGSNGTNILKSIKDGNIAVSDGPLLVQGFSMNGNNTSNELFMGQDTIVSVDDTANLFLNLQYASTVEFGSITTINLILGTSTGETTINIPVTGTSKSISLTQIIALFGVSNVPMNAYFYLRQSTATTKNYGSNSPYIINTETFHALTNPIWIKINTESILPIELLSFYLNVENNSVLLNWETASENNNKGFEIQRKSDNTNWETIGWQDGNGTTSINKLYNFIDNQPYLGNNYYRLKQIDFDNTFNYTNILVANFRLSNNVIAYPNPFKDFLYFNTNINSSRIIIYNVLGEKVLNAEIRENKIDLTKLHTGVYFIEFDQQSTIKDRIKIIKL